MNPRNSVPLASKVLLLLAAFMPVSKWASSNDLVFTDGFEDFNHLPSIDNIEVIGRSKGIVALYDLHDTDADPVEIVVEYTGGSVGVVWATASVDGPTTALQPGDGLRVIWRSDLDEPGIVASDLRLRITPFDADQGTPAVSGAFSINNIPVGGNAPPIVYGVRHSGDSGDIEISYSLYDTEKDLADIAVEYRGGSAGTSWTSATVSGPVAGLVPAEDLSITWRSAVDEPEISADDYELRITPSDDAQGTPGLTGTFSVDNNTSLVLYLPFNGDTLDYSPNGTDATNTGATLAMDRNGNPDSAYFFDDSGVEIYVPDTTSLDVERLTLAFWFTISSVQDARELVNKFGTNGNIAYGAEFKGSNGKINFRICTDGTLGTLTDLPTSASFTVDTWYHFVGTYDGSEMKTYVDGAPDANTVKTGAIFNSSAPLQVGRYGYFTGWDFHGTIDEVVLWNRALTGPEVAALYANGGTP